MIGRALECCSRGLRSPAVRRDEEADVILVGP